MKSKRLTEPVLTELLKQATRRIGQLETELTQYRNAIADGRMVELPCKVGDVVFRISNGNYKSGFKRFVEPLTVTEISRKCDRSDRDLGFAIIANRSRYKFISIGKTIFLSREAAEKALAAHRQGDNDCGSCLWAEG